MKRHLEARSVLTYGTIFLVGLFLLLLASAGFAGGTTLWLTTLVASIIPLIALAAVTSYFFGKSKRAWLTLNKKTSRWLGLLASAAMAASVIITYLSTKQPAFSAHTSRFVLENTGVVLLFGAFVIVLALFDAQRFVYWPFWNGTDQLRSDEREKAVRNRVFEKAYRLNLVVLVLAVWVGQTNSHRLRSELTQVVILCLIGLPAIIASWQKDS